MRQRRRIVYSFVLITTIMAAGLWVRPFRADGRSGESGPVGIASANPAAMQPYLQGAPRKPRVAISAADVWTGREHAAHYTVLDSDSPTRGPSRGEMSLEATERPGRWNYQRLGQRVEFLTVADDGSITMDGLENIERDVTVKLVPAVAVLPARLEPDRPIRREVRMTVYDRQNPSRVKSSGDAVITLCYDADQTLNTPAGKFECRRIRLTWDADFGFGSTSSTTTCYYADDVGLIAENYDAHTTILLFTEERHITAVLAETPRPLAIAE